MTDAEIRVGDALMPRWLSGGCQPLPGRALGIVAQKPTAPSKSIERSGDTDLLLVIDYFLLAISRTRAHCPNSKCFAAS
jgi:hypothetical protein